MYIVCLVFSAVSAVSRVGWGAVRVSRAYADQSIHAQTIIPFVNQEHTLTRACPPLLAQQGRSRQGCLSYPPGLCALLPLAVQSA